VISVQAIVISLESSQIRWNHNLLKSLTAFSVRLLGIILIILSMTVSALSLAFGRALTAR